VKSNPAFGKRVLLEVAQRSSQRYAAELSEYLTEFETAEMYAWIFKEFPPAEDPKRDSEFFSLVSARETIAEFRDSLLRRLQERGTPAAVRAVEWIAAECGSTPLMKWILVETKRLAASAAWHPLEPMDLARSVHSG
jgi:hypothetical protein